VAGVGEGALREALFDEFADHGDEAGMRADGLSAG
jgi:hypothetical protein